MQNFHTLFLYPARIAFSHQSNMLRISSAPPQVRLGAGTSTGPRVRSRTGLVCRGAIHLRRHPRGPGSLAGRGAGQFGAPGGPAGHVRHAVAARQATQPVCCAERGTMSRDIFEPASPVQNLSAKVIRRASDVEILLLLLVHRRRFSQIPTDPG